MIDIPDFNDVPESFYTVGWWKKPNPFPEDMNEGRKRRQYLRELAAELKELKRISDEGQTGLYDGPGQNKWPERRQPKVIDIADARRKLDSKV